MNGQDPSTPNQTRDTLAYILLLTGLFLLFFEPAYAGMLIGVIFGLYFTKEIIQFFKNNKQWREQIGQIHSFALIVLLIALVLSAPFIFIGAAVAVAVRQFLD